MKLFAPALLAAALVSTGAFAADLAQGTALGHTEDEVRASLVSMGYEVRKIEDEDGKIEAYVVKDKSMGEVYVDPASGQVARLSMK
ncbi:PepSY domain-containing protein [Poseidonocella sp. HB161398]|uniref:PepSY domain-containing protein n=1 Tax=Poseidonocella sp. HB161398 TaxID=2320855 RepID=UPI001486598B|nr:PepSY domain-containing protein [Poseidonocella sp. HB161398]